MEQKLQVPDLDNFFLPPSTNPLFDWNSPTSSSNNPNNFPSTNPNLFGQHEENGVKQPTGYTQQASFPDSSKLSDQIVLHLLQKAKEQGEATRVDTREELRVELEEMLRTALNKSEAEMKAEINAEVKRVVRTEVRQLMDNLSKNLGPQVRTQVDTITKAAVKEYLGSIRWDALRMKS